MEAFLLVGVLTTMFVRWLVLSGKMNTMDQKIELLVSNQTQPLLTARVYALEQAVKELRALRPEEVRVTPAPVATPEPEPVRIPPLPDIPPTPVIPPPRAPEP